MNVRCMFAIAGLAMSSYAFADKDAVSFDVVLLNDGKVVASPRVVTAFGQETTIELPRLMKVAAVAAAPNSEGRALTSVKMSVYQDGAMGPEQSMSMLADLTKTPSFEYSVPGTTYRFVVMPRMARTLDRNG